MPDKDDKFTESARKALVAANEEALRFNHSFIGTEHLLLGIVRDTGSVAGQALNVLGVDPQKVRSAVEYIIGFGPKLVGTSEIGLTPRSKKSIELAVEEARHLKRDYVGAEHLLLGLIREREGIAAGVLASLNVELEKTRQAVLSLEEGADKK